MAAHSQSSTLIVEHEAALSSTIRPSTDFKVEAWSKQLPNLPPITSSALNSKPELFRLFELSQQLNSLIVALSSFPKNFSSLSAESALVADQRRDMVAEVADHDGSSF